MVLRNRLSVAAALTISLFNIEHVFAHNKSEELLGLAKQRIVTKQVAAKEAEFQIGDIDNPTGWHIVQEPRLIGFKQIDEYVTIQNNFEKTCQRVGGPGTLHPESRGARVQRIGRLAKKTAGVAWNVAEPFLFSAATRAVGDVVLSQVGPWLVDNAGRTAASVASRANSWWTQFDPTGYADQGIRNTAAAVAEGEMLRDLGTLTYYAETYGVPAVKTTYKATVLTAQGLYKGVQLTAAGTSKAYSWCKSWFNQSTQSEPIL